MTNWIKTEYGGYSDTNQSVEWKDILDWQVNMFFYSCYLYYVLDNPKLSDDNFDAIVRVLEDHYDELPERITITCKKWQIKPNAHAFAEMLTDKEIKDALDWKNNWYIMCP